MKNQMIIRLLCVCMAASLSVGWLTAHPDDGAIKGVVRDSATGLTLPGATISCIINGRLQGALTDANGIYILRPLPAGTYDLSFSFTGYQKIIKTGVRVTSGGITFVDIQLRNDNTLPPVIVSAYRYPLISKDFTGGSTIISQEDIELSVERDIRNLVAQTTSVYQREENGSLNIRGSRSDATLYYIDGIRVIGGFNLPKSAIKEIKIISGGVPAQYGDATGGIVVITTKSAFDN